MTPKVPIVDYMILGLQVFLSMPTHIDIQLTVAYMSESLITPSIQLTVTEGPASDKS